MSYHSYLTGTVHVFFLSDGGKKKNKKMLKKAIKKIKNVRGSETGMNHYINASDEETFIITLDGSFRDTKTIRTVLCAERWLKDLNDVLTDADEMAGIDCFNLYVYGDGTSYHLTAENFDEYKWTKLYANIPTLMQAFREKDEKSIAFQKENGFLEIKESDTEEDLLKRCFGAYYEYLSFTGEKLFDEKISTENGVLKIEYSKRKKPKKVTKKMQELIDYSYYYWDADMSDQIIRACGGDPSNENIIEKAEDLIW